MTEGALPASKRMLLRYAGTCRNCGIELPAGTDAIYERAIKTVRCVECVPTSNRLGKLRSRQPNEDAVVVDPGSPGGSARREFERRQGRREARIRDKRPRLGGLILALSKEPPSTTAWATGAVGEERLGARLDELASETLRVLHDRRIPGSRANIDHLIVAPTGVYVVDTKRYQGRPRLHVEGGLLRPRVEKLLVGGRDCTKLVDGVRKQVEIVRDVVEDRVPVHGVLCFVEADWPLVGGSFTIRGVDALWPRKLDSKLASDGPLSHEVLVELHRGLAATFSPA